MIVACICGESVTDPDPVALWAFLRVHTETRGQVSLAELNRLYLTGGISRDMYEATKHQAKPLAHTITIDLQGDTK